MSAVAAIDVGSNAIRLAVGSLNPSHELFIIERSRERIRLGQDTFAMGEIAEQTIVRMEAAFAHFKEIIDRLGITKVRAVGTSALREARNGAAVVSRINKSSGITIEIIPGDEEARLVAKAILSKVDLAKKRALLIDIGGGSTEVSLVDNGTIQLAESFKVGTIRLLQILGKQALPRDSAYHIVNDYAKGMRDRIGEKLTSNQIAICLGTGGNLEALADLKPLLLQKGDTSFMTADEIAVISEMLQRMTLDERIEKLKLREDRADVIVTAGILLQGILGHINIEQISIPRIGLKEGVLLQLLEDSKPRP